MGESGERRRTGRCACGAISYVVTGDVRDVYDCHCDRCRRHTGHHMAATAAPTDRIEVAGDADLTWWSEDGTTEYGFCRRCGSSLFWRATAVPTTWSIAAGTLDAPTGLRTTAVWWTDTASDYVVLPPGVEQHPGDG